MKVSTFISRSQTTPLDYCLCDEWTMYPVVLNIGKKLTMVGKLQKNHFDELHWNVAMFS